MNDITLTGRAPKRSKSLGAWRKLRRYPTAVFGFAVFGFFLLMALIGPMVAPFSYSAQNIPMGLQPPSATHLLGTDNFGRDIFSRIIIGSRDVYVAAGAATALAVVFGCALGMFSGYKGGIIDELLMRVIDVIMSIPSLLLAMVVLFSLGPSRLNLIL